MNEIKANGWIENSCWDNCEFVEDLYKKRCNKEVVEMTCHKQASKILKKYSKDKDSLLDVGCGSGCFYHSTVNQSLNLRYYGIDSSKKLIKIGKKNMPNYGLNSNKLVNMRIEDVSGKFDHIICINVLTYLDNIYKHLEKLIKIANKTIIIRESFYIRDIYKYVPDNFLDHNLKLNTYVNTYSVKKISNFLKNFDCKFSFIQDEYTNGKVTKVIGYNHYWKFLKIIKN